MKPGDLVKITSKSINACLLLPTAILVEPSESGKSALLYCLPKNSWQSSKIRVRVDDFEIVDIN